MAADDSFADKDFERLGVDDEQKKLAEQADDSDSDPEMQAEMKYAKEHGLDANNLPMRQRLKLIRKAKGLEETSRQLNGVVQVPRSQKNQRKSRTAKRKGGAPKKAGSGGKWTWGCQENLYEEPEFVDSDDPNYDSDQQGKVRFSKITPEMGEGEYEHYAESIIMECLNNGDVKNAVESLDELNLSKGAKSGVVRLTVTLAMDRKPSSRELASQLLAEMHSWGLLDDGDAARGFVKLLNTDLPDLAIDYPDAADIVGKFAARAAADEALPPAFLNKGGDGGDWDTLVSNPHAKLALEKAELMLLEKHRLDTIWCPGGGTRPVRYLVTKIKELLDEYLTSGDLQEAIRCVIDLEVPHFHHEIVFQAGVKTIESMHERTARVLSALLKHLVANDLLSEQTLRVGFDRLYAEMPDLCLDVPPAYTLLERWLAACKVDGFLPEDVARKMPQKGRKRIVSEGDGGRLKVVDVAHPLI